MGRWLGCALLGSLLFGGCAADDESRQSKCERMREHFVELRVSGLPVQHREPHRVALRQALGERFEDECKSLRVHIQPGHIKRPPVPTAGIRCVVSDGVRRSARREPRLGRS